VKSKNANLLLPYADQINDPALRATLSRYAALSARHDGMDRALRTRLRNAATLLQRSASRPFKFDLSAYPLLGDLRDAHSYYSSGVSAKYLEHAVTYINSVVASNAA
jgi:hypothetical protein